MDNPSLYGDPAFYHGSNWYYGSANYGGVHTNSGVQNYWFYLLSSGSSGAPEGTFGSISVNGIGSDKARNIAFYNLDNFLGNNSNYNDSRNGSVLAAYVLYGSCSEESKQTVNAWAAVGIGNAITPINISEPSFITYTPGTPPTVPINYVATGGDNVRIYNWSYSGAWSYSILSPSLPWGNTFSITNFNSSYPIVSTITASDRCTSKSKNIHLINRDHLIELSPNPVLNDMNIRINYLEISESNPINVIITDIQGNIKHESI